MLGETAATLIQITFLLQRVKSQQRIDDPGSCSM
jgi:hypothetical protein